MKTKRAALIVIIILSIISSVIYISPIGRFTGLIDSTIENPSFETENDLSWVVANPDPGIDVRMSDEWKAHGTKSLWISGTPKLGGITEVYQLFTMPKYASKITIVLHVPTHYNDAVGYRISLCVIGDPRSCIYNPIRTADDITMPGTYNLTINIPESMHEKGVKFTLISTYTRGVLINSFWDNVVLK